ncbi:hypothetical protein VX037_11190 [Gordonia sp. Z-3]|uniref:Low molecular weight antigen MTB12-like C-terminal domain-containing protein n=2 Tax=Gordonia TaxID=2053 RepID=A0A9X3I3Q1_9ACTN|nr:MULTISPECIES: hypothetical protein [Gordonia]MAU81135.1 hypothetical protein [Gordonia sp. (in: high G+C Gram-positive bacteria)]MCF3938458.1 hypothetical protein [Gordonia tangerina]MCX2963897.1 hypothetical protein [Gordonia aquimaris]MED5801592.1 hypothetical protein [Gordonia sp. Z-3]
MKFPKIVTAALIAGAVASVAACGSDDSDVPEVPTVSSATAAASGEGGGVNDPDTQPSVAVLNQMLEEALDPNVPNSEKTELVEGSAADPAIFDELVKAKQDNPDVTYEIFPPVIPAGPNKATVKVQVKLPDNPPTKLDASIVYVDGRWKLSRDTVCPLISANNVQTPMCTDSAAASESGN